MMLIFDIKNPCPLDESKLLNEIFYYENKGSQPYLFMNQSTIDTLTKYTENVHNTSLNRSVTTYRGYKVFADNTLEYGKVELR